MPAVAGGLRDLSVHPQGRAIRGIRCTDGRRAVDAVFRHGPSGLGTLPRPMGCTPRSVARPRAQRILADTNPTQARLFELFNLDKYAPRRLTWVIHLATSKTGPELHVYHSKTR
jgi:hypothetical protein